MTEEITTDECIKLINQGLATEKYAEWATTGSAQIKLALVSKGYALDILIHDPSLFIRGRVMLADPSYVRYRMHHLAYAPGQEWGFAPNPNSHMNSEKGSKNK